MNYEESITNYELRITKNELRITKNKLWIRKNQLREMRNNQMRNNQTNQGCVGRNLRVCPAIANTIPIIIKQLRKDAHADKAVQAK
jgi:hypothetical protein